MSADIVALPGSAESRGEGARNARQRDTLALVRLLRLASPTLPVGAFGYSQGLETAIGQGWVRDEASIGDWICDVLEFNIARFEAPVLHRLMLAWSANDVEEVRRLNDWFLAARETAEFRAETAQMGVALRQLFEATKELPEEEVHALRLIDPIAFPTAFAFAATRWQIDPLDALSAYLFAWAENQVNGAMKAVRLGHVGAQRILAQVAVKLSSLAQYALRCGTEERSNATPGLAIASCLHELQDGRVFRS